jgi:outer membrane protein assembly factor BamB
MADVQAGEVKGALSAEGARQWKVRVWPGVVIVGMMIVVAIVPQMLWPLSLVHFLCMAIGLILGPVAVMVWWAVGAKVRGWERLLLPGLMVVPVAVLGATVMRQSVECLLLYPWPSAAIVAVLWLAGTWWAGKKVRRIGLVTVMLILWGVTGMVRFDGMQATGEPNVRWAWQPTAEEKFMEGRKAAVAASAVPTGAEALRGRTMVLAKKELPAVKVGAGDWAQFRGPKQDGRLTGVSIDTDWAAHMPKLVWKQRVGPGWGSFAVASGRLFTQEQRKAEEAVVCYDAESGEELWAWSHAARFEEESSGAGPRATPTIDGGRLYAMGATGVLTCLEARDGKWVWSTDVQAATNGVMPQWGYASSPLVLGGKVMVFAGGKDGKGTAAFDAGTGKLAWAAGKAGHSYSSAHRAVLGGVEQVLMISEWGIESFAAEDGKVLWAHEWPTIACRVVQPVILGETDVLVGSGTGQEQGVRRLHVTNDKGTWKVEVVWTARNVRPYFNDGVVVGQYYFGFDNDRLCCLDLNTGTRVWTTGGYGNGEVLGLADQEMLLVLGVKGNVALVKATGTYTEVAKFQALKDKTWNHPVIVGGKLFVRNAVEAACYALP